MEDFDRSILFGVIFDLPPSRMLEELKESLVKYLVGVGLSARMYVARPDAQIPRDQGESVYYVASYKEPKINIGQAFKETIMLIGQQNENCEKYILLITDNFKAPVNQLYRKGFMVNAIRGYESKIVVFALPNSDRMILKSITEANEAQYIELDEPAQIGTQLSKILEK